MVSEKNILIVSKSAEPGGLEFHVLDLIKVFAGANRVYLFVPEGPLVDQYKSAGAEVLYIYPKSSFDISFISAVKNFCKQKNIHILHAHELINTQAILGGFLAGVQKRIYHVHTPFLFWKYPTIVNKIVKSIPNWIANFFTGNFLSTDVICLTPIIKKHRMLFELIYPSKLKVIPNAVDISRFEQVPSFEELDLMKKRMGIAPDKVVIGNVSRLTREKGHMVLIKAFEMLNKENPGRYHLLLAGGGELEEEYTKYCEQYISGSYSITGKFDESDKVKIMHSINYAVFPSLAEGFGFVLTEFMAAKIPIIASDIAVLKYTGGNGVWYFKSGNYKDLYTKLKELLSLSDKMISYKVNNGYLKVQEYTLEAFAKNYSTVYDRVRA